jgi:hypothetical protein
MIGKAGGMEAIINAMNTHLESVTLQTPCMTTIYLLSLDASNKIR